MAERTAAPQTDYKPRCWHPDCQKVLAERMPPTGWPKGLVIRCPRCRRINPKQSE